MSYFFWSVFSFVCRTLLSLRYRIEVTGLDLLVPQKLDRRGGILFMPNHPAHMDPLFIFLWLWPKYQMRPLVIEYVYRLPFLRIWMKVVKALSIPNFDTSVNELKIKKGQESIQRIADGLKRKENFVLYPAGRLKSGGKEIVGGASGAHGIVQECPDANVVLIRTSGLWGSSFSRALLGRSPDLSKTIWHGIQTILKNFILFAPRRKVYIEIEPNPEGLPRSESRIEFNRFLEKWYDRYRDDQGKIHKTEPLKLVSYSFWRNEIPTPFKPKKKGSLEGEISISEETRERVYAEIRRILENPSLAIAPENSLSFDLGMDSLNVAELIAYLTKNYDIEELHPEDVDTVQNALEMAEGGKKSDRPIHQVVQVTWPEETGRIAPALPEGKTIAEAFLNACRRMPRSAACGDDLVGVLSYKKLKRAALVLAVEFRTLPERYVGVLLPASAGAFVVILALQFAGKIPVMLNWTLGSRYLDEMIKLTGIKTVISSWRFLDRLSHVEFGSVLDKVKLLEDIRAELTLKTKLTGAFYSLLSNRSVIQALDLDRIDENTPAVILFTSGTEANPKGVPLSHKNIIANQRSAMQCIDLRASDVMYGILPPFHSFGFSVAGLFPLLGNIRVAFYPDPTDGFALAEGAERWKITLFCGAPSFLKGLFSAAKPEQLKTIRYFVSGAEKAPPELFERVAKLETGAKIIEGYGITECAPILTINRPNLPPRGVGRILPDIELCTIHPESLESLPEGSEGEICVRGPNVFNGYLGNPRTPFIQINEKRWYRTGDLGHLEKDGTLILSGRLKRFTKVGGEMISLGAIEETFSSHFLREGRVSPDKPFLAVCSDERIAGKAQLILFTTLSIDKEAANEILKQAGFSRLVKISSVQKVEEIPLLGTGKTDYRRLQSLVA